MTCCTRNRGCDPGLTCIKPYAASKGLKWRGWCKATVSARAARAWDYIAFLRSLPLISRLRGTRDLSRSDERLGALPLCFYQAWSNLDVWQCWHLGTEREMVCVCEMGQNSQSYFVFLLYCSITSVQKHSKDCPQRPHQASKLDGKQDSIESDVVARHAGVVRGAFLVHQVARTAKAELIIEVHRVLQEQTYKLRHSSGCRKLYGEPRRAVTSGARVGH